eukprot:c40220_g1_i1 orf=18-260(-)
MQKLILVGCIYVQILMHDKAFMGPMYRWKDSKLVAAEKQLTSKTNGEICRQGFLEISIMFWQDLADVYAKWGSPKSSLLD